MPLARQVSDDLLERVAADRHDDAHRSRAVEQPIEMPVQFEDAAVVGADALEDSVAVQQTVIEDVDRRFMLVT